MLPPAEKLQNFFGVFLQFQTGVDTGIEAAVDSVKPTEVPKDIPASFLHRKSAGRILGLSCGFTEINFLFVGHDDPGVPRWRNKIDFRDFIVEALV